MDAFVTSFLCFLGLVLSIMVGTILMFFPLSKGVKSPSILLSIAFFMQAYNLFIGILLNTGYLLHVPHLYRTGIVMTYLMVPIFYLYIRNVIKRKELQVSDLLFFVPALLIFFDLLPFFLSDSAIKHELILKEINYPQSVFSYKQGVLLKSGVHVMLLGVMFIAFLIPQAIMTFNIYKIKDDKFWSDNSAWVRWLTVFVINQIIYILPIIFFFGKLSAGFWMNWGIIFFGCSSLISGTYLMTNPEILYGLRGIVVRDVEAEPVQAQESSELERNTEPQKQMIYLNEEQLQRVTSCLEPYIKEHKPYLIKGITISEIARETGLSSRLISAYLNQHLETNFYEYMNRFRVEHIVLYMNKEDLKILTLEAIAENVGFNNRTSFVNAVKKNFGMTPSQYISAILNNNFKST